LIRRHGGGHQITALVALLLLGVLPAAPTHAAEREVVAPATMVTVLDHGAWSWFEDARATFSADGTSLLASAVAGTGATEAAPGTVVLSDLDLGSGDRKLVDLGRAESDDHNSASIDSSSSGELLTAWSRHHADLLVRHQRRRTDGSWLRLPPITAGALTTYNNLRRAADAEGNPILYDFVRGVGLDPVALASSDEGRTWQNLGPILRDPMDSPNQRPYVQYAEARAGRIDLLATETHPSASATSIYHGYLQGGFVHDSTGTVLGPIGAGIPVTDLTQVWAASGGARGWTADIELDPVTGAPIAAFSVTLSPEDHRYWLARWDGDGWAAEEVAHAGRRLFSGEPHYTGLAAIDPQDPDRVVISTDAHPDSGAPLVSATDGRRHWELWEGRSVPGAGWSWVPLTAASSEDNLRPVLISHPDGATALLWLRGTYTSFLDYDTEVVGVVTRPDGTAVPGGGSRRWVPAVDVLRLPEPLDAPGRAVVGDFDGHAATDVLIARPGERDDLLLGDEERHPTPVTAPTITTGATPVAGDFDRNGRTDVLWYTPGSGAESLWRTSGIARFAAQPTPQVRGTYLPVPGDFDGDLDTDILWYAPGRSTDHLWTSTPAGFTSRASPLQVSGTYRPIPADVTGDGRTDIYWYAAGRATDHLWKATTTGFRSEVASRQVTGTFEPASADFDGNGRDDLLWYAPGGAADYLWLTSPAGFSTQATPNPVNGTYLPLAGDHDADGRGDVHWWAPGPAADHLWWSADGPLAQTEAAAANL
jgi:hypothetical protein